MQSQALKRLLADHFCPIHTELSLTKTWLRQCPDQKKHKHKDHAKVHNTPLCFGFGSGFLQRRRGGKEWASNK